MTGDPTLSSDLEMALRQMFGCEPTSDVSEAVAEALDTGRVSSEFSQEAAISFLYGMPVDA